MNQIRVYKINYKQKPYNKNDDKIIIFYKQIYLIFFFDLDNWIYLQLL